MGDLTTRTYAFLQTATERADVRYNSLPSRIRDSFMADSKKIDTKLVALASDLLSVLNELLNLGEITKENLQAANEVGTRLSKAAQDLDLPFKELKKSADKLKGDDTFKDANDDVKDIMTRIDLKPLPLQRSKELKDLLANVSDSLISAQKSLNESSLQYASELDPRLPQTIYGIPSVKAEMRVGFSEIKSRGINLFLFTRKEQRDQYAESTVSFEVVGTPPPPGPAAYGNYVVPIPRFLVIGDKRAEILAKLKDKITGQIYTDNEKYAVVLRYEPSGEKKEEQYFVQWMGKTVVSKDFPSWQEISFVYAIEDADGELRFPTNTKDSIFEFPPANGVFVAEPSTIEGFKNQWKELIKKISDPATTPADRQKAVDELTRQLDDTARNFINLGDVAMNYNRLVYDWLEAVTYRRKEIEA